MLNHESDIYIEGDSAERVKYVIVRSDGLYYASWYGWTDQVFEAMHFVDYRMADNLTKSLSVYAKGDYEYEVSEIYVSFEK